MRKQRSPLTNTILKLADMKGNWTQNFDAVKSEIVKHGGFSWQQLVGNDTCQGPVIKNDSTCAAKMRVACRADSVYQQGAMMYGLSGYFTPADMPQALANFMLIRGKFAWLGYSWRPCTTGGENKTNGCAGGHGFVQPDGTVLCETSTSAAEAHAQLERCWPTSSNLLLML